MEAVMNTVRSAINPDHLITLEIPALVCIGQCNKRRTATGKVDGLAAMLTLMVEAWIKLVVAITQSR